MKYIGMSWSL